LAPVPEAVQPDPARAGWPGLAAASLLGLLVAVVLHLQGPQRELFIALNGLGQVVPDPVWAFLTLLGDTAILFVLLSPLLCWRPHVMLAVVASIPLGGLLSVLLKRLLDAPRPGAVLDATQFHLIGPLLSSHSFPSGHTITAFAAATAVAVAGRSVLRSRTARLALPAGVFMLAALVGLSRVAVGAHWPVDVAAGACAGVLAGLSGAALGLRVPARWRHAGAVPVAALLLGSAGVWVLMRRPDYPQGVLAVWLAAAAAAGTLAIVAGRAWHNRPAQSH
jgi:membrane-associated phospholipid phosphatase